MRKLMSAIALTGAAALTLTACGGGASGTADGELTPVTVGVMPIVDTAAIYVGDEQGFFEEEGLDLTLEAAQGGAAIVPAVLSGDYEFGFSNVVSLVIAQSKGTPVKMIAPAASTRGSAPDIGAVVVREGSTVKTAKDLEGKKVATNTLNNIGDLTTRHMVEKAGGDDDKIQFVEMGFPDMPAALSSGQVEAAWLSEPHLTRAVQDGGTVLTWNFFETDPNLMIAAYFANSQYAEQNPEVVEAFTRAMEKSLKFAEENPDVTREVLDTYTEIDPAVKEAMEMPKFTTEVPREPMQKIADLSLHFGMIDKEADLDALLP